MSIFGRRGSASSDEEPESILPALMLCLLLGMWIAFTPFLGFHQSDSLVPILGSLYYWTPYFWGVDRIGQLAGLLTMPITHPFWNNIAQTTLGIFSGLAAVYLLMRVLFPYRNWSLWGTIAVTLAILFVKPGRQFEYLSGYQPYGHSLVLALLAILLIESSAERRTLGRWTMIGVAFLLLLLAHWVNMGVGTLLVPMLLFQWLLTTGSEYRLTRALEATQPALATGTWRLMQPLRQLIGIGLTPPRRQMILTIVLLVATFGMNMIFRRMVRTPMTASANLKTAPLSQWPTSIARTLQQAALDIWSWPFAVVLLCLTACLVGLTLFRRTRSELVRYGAAGMVAALGALVYSLFVGTRTWVILNAYNSRYMFPASVVALTVFVGICLGPMGTLVRRRIPAFALAVVLLMGATFTTWGIPSYQVARDSLDRSLGTLTEDMLACRCTHFMGDYWKTFVTVYHTNLTLHEMGEQRRVWGITYYSWVNREAWRYSVPTHQLRIAFIPWGIDAACAAHPEREIRSYEFQYSFPPLEVAQTLPSFVVLSPPRDWDSGVNVVCYRSVDLQHHTGATSDFGWHAEPGLHQPGFLTRGPSTVMLPQEKLLAKFHFRVDEPVIGEEIVKVDVTDNVTGKVLAERLVALEEVGGGGDEFVVTLPFELGSNHAVEFRTYWFGTTAVAQREVRVEKVVDKIADAAIEVRRR